MTTRASRLLTLPRQGLLAALLATAAIVPLAPRSYAAPAQRVAAAPCIPAGHGSKDIPAIAFGRRGGNIRPMQVLIYGDGTIRYQGAAPISPTYSISSLAVLGLQRLARAEGFYSMPPLIANPKHLPDFATLFITIRAGCATQTTTVRSNGGQAAGGFDELYATLTAAVALGSGA
jgi:hypothetical protein